MNLRFQVLLLSTAAFVFAHCKKEKLPQDCPPDLPCVTHYGAKTFGCYVNGKPWVADVAPYILDPTAHRLIAQYDEPGTGENYGRMFQINAIKVDSTVSDFFVFSCSPLLGEGNLEATELKFLRFELYQLVRPYQATDYFLDTLSPYQITITKLDTVRNIAAGTFEFRAVSEDKKDTLEVTDGRFDVHYGAF